MGAKVSLPKHNKVRTVDLSPKTVLLLSERANARSGSLVFPSIAWRIRL